MSTSGINPLLTPQTFTGVSSFSSDLQQILQRAVQIASLPMQQLQINQADVLAQQKAFGDLENVVSNLTTSFSNLGVLGANGALAATTSNAAVATVQVTGSPSALNYTLNVVSAAAAAQASTNLALPDSTTTAPRANGLYTLTLGSNTQAFDLLATGSGRTAGTTGTATPSPPASVAVSFASGLAGSITANLNSFFVGNATVGGASAGDTVTVNFTSADSTINTGVTAVLAGGEDATALAGELNAQITGNASLNGKVSFSAVNGQLKLTESDTVGQGFTFTAGHTGTVTTGIESGGTIGGESAQEIAAALNAQVALNSTLHAAGVTFSNNGGQVQATAAAGKQFTFTATDIAQGTGFVSGLAGRTRVVGFANTLSGLAGYINSQDATLGVHATIINTSSNPSSPKYDLTLVADQTGVQTLTLNDSAATDLLPNGGTLGTNAVFSLNGGPNITNTSNTIANLAPGLNLTIIGSSAGVPINITVAKDRTSVLGDLQDFATRYNAVADYITTQVGQNAGPLAGSLALRQVETTLQSITGYSISTGAVQNMAGLGLFLDQNGHLSVDLPTFNGLTDPQFTDAVSFLGSTTTGFAGNAYSRLTQISDPTTGSIQNEQSFLTQSDQRLSDQIVAQQQQVNLLQTSLTAQLSQSDTLLAQLESQQSLLTGLFKDQQAISLEQTLA
ncbi:MAG TPA: flagellar filament capping protein FliD [Bryobacterales bacterium]|nr:flagellar filament capping protein FliD [Bryobacterales bacterium]